MLPRSGERLCASPRDYFSLQALLTKLTRVMTAQGWVELSKCCWFHKKECHISYSDLFLLCKKWYHWKLVKFGYHPLVFPSGVLIRKIAFFGPNWFNMLTYGKFAQSVACIESELSFWRGLFIKSCLKHCWISSFTQKLLIEKNASSD